MSDELHRHVPKMNDNGREVVFQVAFEFRLLLSILIAARHKSTTKFMFLYTGSHLKSHGEKLFGVTRRCAKRAKQLCKCISDTGHVLLQL